MIIFERGKYRHSLCIINYKGGVGKTTITTLLGIYLAWKKRRRVLLMDIDPQCSLSLALGEDPEKISGTELTIYNLVKPEAWGKLEEKNLMNYTKGLKRHYFPSNLHLLPGSFETDELDFKIMEAILNDKEHYTKQRLFSHAKKLLMGFAKDYDYILVDCPPNKMFLTQAMLRACSFYLPVTIPDRISTYGMPRLIRWVKGITGQEPHEEPPKMLGYVLNALNRSGGSGMVISQFNACVELERRVKESISYEEREVLTDPCLGEIPRLDVIAKFLGGDSVTVSDLQKSQSLQKSVAECLRIIVEKIFKRISGHNE